MIHTCKFSTLVFSLLKMIFIGKGEYFQPFRLVRAETDRLQLEIHHYNVVNNHNQGILAEGLEELRGNLQEVTRVHHSNVSTFRVQLARCQHAIGEIHHASAAYVSHVSFGGRVG